VRNETAPVLVTSARPQRGSRKRLMSCGLWVAVVTATCWVTALVGAEAGQRAAEGTGDAARSAALRVCLLVSVRATHPWVDLWTTKREVAKIWQANGVDVVYSTPGGEACPDTTHRTVLLLLTNRPEELPRRLTGSLSSGALGSTVNSQGVPTALVLAFADRVVAAVSEIRACSAAHSACVSRLLGRVVAHELGHVLLRTSEHSRGGLMRPIFDIDDALAAPADAYMLAADERDRVARHLRERRRGAPDTEVASSR
jgi:hypothetical protein